ncbi:MAG: carboxypeptidase-like regulatory domain-containing protein, partial [Candidatus Methanoperedens sp.]|nr:carboxypeptidase-like regulatory domain-containing protein [Candidatus Methanoperedens sp.]
MITRREKLSKQGIIRLLIFALILLSGAAVALLMLHPLPSLTQEKRTSGDLVFLDGTGNLLNGTIEIIIADSSSNQSSNVSSISWKDVPNARISFDALETKNISISLRISGDSHNSNVVLENYGTDMPVNTSAPGIPVKYVQIRDVNVSFAEADIVIQYTDEELKGLDEEELAIYRYDISNATWNDLPTKINATNNMVSTTAGSLSIFAVGAGINEVKQFKGKNNLRSGALPFLEAKKKHFSLDENPEFIFEYIGEDEFKSKSSGPGVRDVRENALNAQAIKKEIKSFVYNNGELTDIEPDVEELREGKISLKLPGSRAIKPGIYTLKVELVKDGITYAQEQEFQWGLVSLNTRKSIYKPGEPVELIIVVLDRYGHPVCNSDISLLVNNPNGEKTTYSTGNGTIASSGECGIFNAIYPAELEGVHEINITALVDDIVVSFNTHFLVQQDCEFDIVRTAQILTWKINLTERKTPVIYSYSVPHKWPYLYALGPLEIDYQNRGSAKTFTEARPWYIAVDPAGSWWNASWTYRKQINVTTGANSPYKGYKNYTVRLTTNTTGTKFMGNGNDTRIVYWNGTGNTELDREILNPNSTATNITFMLQANISASSYDNNYYLYYGNPTADAGPNNRTKVYLWYDNASSDRESEYTQGRVDLTAQGGVWANSIAWNAAGYYTFDTGDNFADSMRPTNLGERDAYVEYEEYQTNAYLTDMTSGPLSRWNGTGSGGTEDSSHWYYYEMADSTYLAGSYASHDDITADDRGIVVVTNGLLGAFPATTWTRIGIASWGINPTNLKAYYNNSSGGWGGSRFSGTHAAASDNENPGQFGIWLQQDAGRIRNIIIRRYTEPEPSLSTLTEEESNITKYSLSGYVTDTSSGLPLSGATVTTNTSLSTITNASGFYNFTGLLNSTYIISANLTGYDTNSTTVTISGSNVTEANISLSPMPTYVLSGYVTNESSGLPISGANVTTNTSLNTTTDATGFYNFTIYNGVYILTASKANYTDNSTTVTVSDADVLNADIKLTPEFTGSKIWVATSRFVILDDPRTGTADTGSGFVNPAYDYNSWNYWTGRNTIINATALYIDAGGAPVPNMVINFTLYLPNGTALASINDTTNLLGLANFSFDLNARNYYGNWKIGASNRTLGANTTFIYNWWGCAYNAGSCNFNHQSNNRPPDNVNSANVNSPYLSGRDTTVDGISNHYAAATNCTFCHQSYDGLPGSQNPAINHTNNPLDVHRSISCSNTNCHQSGNSHRTNAVINSCYNSGCHTSRADISSKSTLSSATVSTATSLYSYNNGSSFNATFHTPNSTVPCFTCHGPMHNITKPVESQRFIKNNITENEQCTVCHTTYSKHNNTVNCTLCHSDDVHVIRVFATNATYITSDRYNPNPARGNCSNCHQNSTFYSSLKAQSLAGNQTGGNPPQIAVPLLHSDNNIAGTVWDNFWTPQDPGSACRYCHSDTSHKQSAFGRPARFMGTNTKNSTIGNTTWCPSCHYPGYANYSDMISAFTADGSLEPPSNIRDSTYFRGGRDHSTTATFIDSVCYSCHNGSRSYTGITQFMHGVSVGGGGPDCLGCHDIGSSRTEIHVNNTAMKLSVHANLNSNAANSSYAPADNKKCWGCHQSDGSQPGNSSMGDIFSRPYTCYSCHSTDTKPYPNADNAATVINHIDISTSQTRILTFNATCITCHNNSVNLGIANITDPRNISAAESISHYGSTSSLVETIGNVKPEGCIYCHLNATNASIWGQARDPRLDPVRPHTETKNTQCYLCHIEGAGAILPPDFHNESLYYAGEGKILAAANRYVILDDPRRTGAKADTMAGFAIPDRDWNSNYWTGKNTKINATALYLNRYGEPVSGKVVSFTLYFPNGTALTIVNDTTNSRGLANFSFDLNARNYFGSWKIRATNGSLGVNTTFIYNWWGCTFASGSCTGHGEKNPSTGATANSPYLSGRDPTTGKKGEHQNFNCTLCHQSFDGRPGGTNSNINHWNKPADVHRNISCSNSNCHGSYTTHNSNQLIYSCYNSGCHGNWSSWDRKDISNKSTLSSATVSTALSLYSNNNGSSFNATFHTPNSTVPCFICHGPMHAITKPDTAQRFIRNSDTESTQCTTCHQDYSKHNNSVGCTVCHSDDVHVIQVVAQNATYVTLNHNNHNPATGNCTNCHQNSSFLNTLLSRIKAGNYTGKGAPQVAVPLEHSNDPTAGAKWNQTPGYWNNSNQLTWCEYCHSNEIHNVNILGNVGLFKGNNTVNSTLGNTTWCASCHWQGYANGTDNYNDMVNVFFNVPVPPEISGNSQYGANTSIYEYTNHSGYTKYYPNMNDSSCNRCHGYPYGFTRITQLMHNLTRVGGANCVDCHDLNGIVLLSRINVTSTNDTNALHRNLNNGTSASNATAYYSNNRRCWACHSNGSEPQTPYAHPTKYKIPYNCTDCHVPGAAQNFNYTPSAVLNVTEHYWNGSDIRTPSAAVCYKCHNLSEMMIFANDPDSGSGAVYGGANGGNNSSSHYGKKRADLRIGSSANCSYCHQNTSSAFAPAMIDPAYNTSISNHSLRYNSSNPTCITSQCHNTGWMHNSTLFKPDLSLPNSSYCLVCHGNNGSGGTNYSSAVTESKEKHNNSVNCTECHQNTGRDIHPEKYLQPNATYSTNNTTAVNCTTCHQTANVDSKLSKVPPKIPSPLAHSDNTSNGSVWNSSYWNSALTACTYCHNDTKHNATALGRPASWRGNNIVNSSISGSSWCSSCHYQGYSGGGKNYTDMTQTFTKANLSVPPEITNGTYATGIYNRSTYYNHSLKDYSDAACRLCHGINLSSNTTVTPFLHNVTWGSCTGCHYSFEAMNTTYRPDRYVDSSQYNLSLHRSLSCKNCHPEGHRNMGARKACEDCHA